MRSTGMLIDRAGACSSRAAASAAISASLVTCDRPTGANLGDRCGMQHLLREGSIRGSCVAQWGILDQRLGRLHGLRFLNVGTIPDLCLKYRDGTVIKHPYSVTVMAIHDS